jgi:esterase/lipase
MVKLLLKIVGISLLGIVVLYAIGPRATYESVDGKIAPLSLKLSDLDKYIAEKEGKISQLKPDNEARIVWNDSTKSVTEYSIVYLHGFSSSQEEGDPIHESFAQRYGYNLYLPRLEDHGRMDSNTFINLTPQSYLESAKEAIAIGNLIGEKTIVMSCSTGGTLSAYLAAENPDKIHAQIMFSPNIDLYDPTSEALTLPWGKEIAEMTFGSEYNRLNYAPEAQKYWNTSYHINGIIAIKSLINQTMRPEVFKKISQPVFLGYYYRNEEEQDKVVSVEEMKEFFANISSPSDQKIMIAFPEAGRHVISSHVMSKDVKGVMTATFSFAEEILKLKPMSK